MSEPRIASHPDQPDDPLANRLMLALGMWPNYVAQLGVDVVIEAAVTIRTAAHLYPMACEDYGAAAEESDHYRAVIDRVIDLLSAGEDDADNEALDLLVAALPESETE